MDGITEREKLVFSNKQYFESRIRISQKLYEEGLYEDCISYIQKTATFGWFNFSGYYKSEELEILLSKIQKKILPRSLHQKKTVRTGKVLHICSEIHDSGGHSKLLYNWIKNDSSKKHSILSTRLSKEHIETVSRVYMEDISELEHLSIKSASRLESVNLLNQLPLNDYDVILLHIHPDETITNIVLSQQHITTPVWIINHADHVFWLGTSIADKVIQIRESNIALDVQRRGISAERQIFLPIPVENILHAHEEKKDFEHQINILSTGTAYKYNPNEKYNFLREAYKAVEENSNIIFNIVGIEHDSEYAKKYLHERIVLHGIISPLKLSHIEQRSHIYVESFPMASFTALLQAALQRIPFVLHYDPLPLFKLFSETEEVAVQYPKDLDEWHKDLNRLIRDTKYRGETAKKQYQYVLNKFSIDVWKSRLAALYIASKSEVHSYWPPTADVFYNGENEKLLVTIDKRTISHYASTNNLSWPGKYFVFLKSKSKNVNVNYGGKKALLKYLFRRP